MLLYKPSFIPTSFTVVGAGGIGSRLIPQLAQLVSSTVQTWLPGVTLRVFDFDSIEDKNLLRQNFVKADVGKYKASVLSQRYSSAYGVPITPHIQRFNGASIGEDDQTSEAFRKHPMVVFSCVDSREARLEILSTLANLSYYNQSIILIDGGNEDTFGQVHITNPLAVQTDLAESLYEKVVKGNLLDSGRFVSPFLSFDWDHYGAPASSSKRELSCADLDQTMAINSMVATGMLGVAQSFIFQQPISYKMLRYDLSFGNSTQPITMKDVYGYGNSHSEKAFQSVHRAGSILGLGDYVEKFVKF